ncbi:MAG: hypothetical protein AAGK00_02450 [Pseudomonadota bacterium]
MFRIFSAFVLALVLSGPTLADETPPEPSAASMAFVGQFSDNHLSGMLSKFGGRMPSLMAYSQLGGEMVATVLDAHIDAAVDKYGDVWQQNLALSWGGLMNDAELASLTEKGAESPYAARYGEVAPQAAQAMQEMSGALFQQILGEVVAATETALSDTATN